MDDYNKIILLMKTDETIPQATVLNWMKSDDLKILGAVFELTIGTGWERIEPKLNNDIHCEFMLRYLIRCIVENTNFSAGDRDFLFSSYEAAQDMVGWINYLWPMKPTTNKILANIEQALRKTYIEGNTDVRNCIVNGTLEHVFEEKKFRSLFKNWEKDPQLSQAYSDAMGWAEYWEKKGKKPVLDAINRLSELNKAKKT